MKFLEPNNNNQDLMDIEQVNKSRAQSSSFISVKSSASDCKIWIYALET